MKPLRGRPLLVKKDTNFTHLVADRVPGLDGASYTVLFIGTGRHVGIEGLCARMGGCPGALVLSLTPVLPPHRRRLAT